MLAEADEALDGLPDTTVLPLLEDCTATDVTIVVMGDGSLWTARSAWTVAPYREILTGSAFLRPPEIVTSSTFT
ncbi:hypothetical protein ACFY0F_29155 [Streptomyces sp. NPDC001544]|uniref:hypothetical protein n=1 Tax=Streptomyces sp. NPDC001544 TaxID=3364584 RepID=UPI003686A39B